MAIAVKTCGLRDRGAVDAALAGGARYLGFVFFPPSPRDVSPHRAAAIAADMPAGTATVGVVVDPDEAFLDGILAALRPDYLQLHGDESPARAEAIRAHTGCGIIKAIKVSSAADIAGAAVYRDCADLMLFDAAPPADATRPGGNAHAFDWRLFERTPPVATGWLLSGGLTAENVGAAVCASGARAVDVSSGIETAPGRKDPARIGAFLAAAAAAAP